VEAARGYFEALVGTLARDPVDEAVVVPSGG
jgi:hypothetical protein